MPAPTCHKDRQAVRTVRRSVAARRKLNRSYLAHFEPATATPIDRMKVMRPLRGGGIAEEGKGMLARL